MSSGFILLMDSGNTRLKYRAISSVSSHSLSSTLPSTLNSGVIDNIRLGELAMLIYQWIKLYGPLQEVYAISVASVSIKQHIEEMLSVWVAPTHIQWLKVSENSLGIKNLYAIEQLGVDRWYGLLGAIYHDKKFYISSLTQEAPSVYQPVLLNISFGTATTIDTLIDDKFMGGLILPGVHMMQRSLYQGTAQLPEVQLPTYQTMDFPQTTKQAIEAGIVTAQVGAVMTQVKKVFAYSGRVPTIYMSGGAKTSITQAIYQYYQEWTSHQYIPVLRMIELDSPVLDGIEAYVYSEWNDK